MTTNINYSFGLGNESPLCIEYSGKEDKSTVLVFRDGNGMVAKIPWTYENKENLRMLLDIDLEVRRKVMCRDANIDAENANDDEDDDDDDDDNSDESED